MNLYGANDKHHWKKGLDPLTLTYELNFNKCTELNKNERPPFFPVHANVRRYFTILMVNLTDLL